MPRQKRAQGQSINMTKEEGADLHGKREGGGGGGGPILGMVMHDATKKKSRQTQKKHQKGNESHQPEWQQRPQDEA